MIKVVVFDLDDTLYPEEEYVISGLKHVSEYLANKFCINQDRLYSSLYNQHKKDTRFVFDRVLKNYGIEYSDSDIKELVYEYRHHSPVIRYYNDVLPTIDTLNKNGIQVGIITDGYLEMQRKKLEALNAYRYFEKIILTDELGREHWKPDLKPFELMKTYFSVRYDEMAYIGDNPRKDFYVSKLVPIVTCRIIRENSIYASETYLENVKENIRINSLYNISKILKM